MEGYFAALSMEPKQRGWNLSQLPFFLQFRRCRRGHAEDIPETEILGPSLRQVCSTLP